MLEKFGSALRSAREDTILFQQLIKSRNHVVKVMKNTSVPVPVEMSNETQIASTTPTTTVNVDPLLTVVISDSRVDTDSLKSLESSQACENKNHSIQTHERPIVRTHTNSDTVGITQSARVVQARGYKVIVTSSELAIKIADIFSTSIKGGMECRSNADKILRELRVMIDEVEANDPELHSRVKDLCVMFYFQARDSKLPRDHVLRGIEDMWRERGFPLSELVHCEVCESSASIGNEIEQMIWNKKRAADESETNTSTHERSVHQRSITLCTGTAAEENGGEKYDRDNTISSCFVPLHMRPPPPPPPQLLLPRLTTHSLPTGRNSSSHTKSNNRERNLARAKSRSVTITNSSIQTSNRGIMTRTVQITDLDS